MRRSADEPRSLTLPGELPNLSGNGRGTLFVEGMVDGARRFWSEDHVPGDRVWARSDDLVKVGRPLDARSTGPVVV
ncbi:unnamed protein product [Arctia plantaginis]|uniref:Uncharacterized protein n=1 Tax=Arctia plantaginis TaxID=874455 RepID=A0A8S1BJV8_ARCPL|nr:unnamed protein product [Arctia plantaginis]